MTRGIMNSLTLSGNIRAVKCSHANGCKWDDWTCYNAAISGNNMELRKWLYSQGCPLNTDTFNVAVEIGNWDVLKWLQSQGCHFDETSCKAAVYSGTLDMLQWLHSMGCF